MKRSELFNIRKEYIENIDYKIIEFTKFDYSILSNIMYIYPAGSGQKIPYNDCIIMADTETSKKYDDGRVYANHVVAWTISIRAFNYNIVTLYGHKPSELVDCIWNIQLNMPGDITIIYWHNMSYDWTFIRKFMFVKYGHPDNQLNTKSHYPIFIKWEKYGLIFKDSLILSQRSLDKWGKDLDVEHKKAGGKWDYEKIRNQNEIFTRDELEYIEHDTLCGVECIDKLMNSLRKHIYSMPYTATGIPREEIRVAGKPERAKELFNTMVLDYNQYVKMEMVYHGGYTHGNRHLIDIQVVNGYNVKCYDFASSYPFVLLSEKFPMERFTPLKNCYLEDILSDNDNAYMFKLIMVGIKLKSDDIPMPALQFSKCVKSINAILDNGRILCADYVEIYLTEIDADIIYNQYEYEQHICTEVEFAHKAYIPKWLTDYVFSLFKEKTLLKDGDPVAYALAKAKLNSIYGMMVQKNIRHDMLEDYDTGEYNILNDDPEELYDKYISRRGQILPYQWGVWVTAYAFRNLFTLGECCETWVYSDTDSCYGINWDDEKISLYNDICKKKLTDNGYGAVKFNNREYWLGIAEFDGEYTEYKVQGAKRYCGRSVDDGELHITVAGVPKKGAICLNNNIDNFSEGLIFPGSVTGKKTHTYIYSEKIWIDKNGNETGDSIDLSQCDYLLSSINTPNWEELISDNIEIQIYEDIT